MPALAAMGGALAPPGDSLSQTQPEDGVSVMDDPPQDPVERLRRLIDARGEESAHVLRHWMDDRKETS